jgi:hypothetical protein
VPPYRLGSIGNHHSLHEYAVADSHRHSDRDAGTVCRE